MAFDGITTACLVKELNKELTGGRINKIAQPESDELLITIKVPTGQKRLVLSASASLPLAYLTDTNKPSPMNAPNFCMLLRKHIGSGRILSITQPSLERIIRFEIEHPNELGDICRKYLILELMGKHSNIIFTDDKEMILDSIKHVSGQMSSVREVLPGRTYFIPDTMEKKDPLDITFDVFREALLTKPCALAKAIYTSLTGISPVCAEEILSIAGIDSSLPPSELSDDLMQHLFRQFSYYMDQVSNGDFSPVIYYDGSEPKDFSALKVTHFANYEERPFDSISEVIRTYYASKEVITRIRQKSTELRHLVSTALERNRKKYDLQCRQMEDTKDREKYKVYGELLHTYGYSAKQGDKSLTALNYYTNEEIAIPLDPQKTAMENAKSYFEKYNKKKRTYEALQELVEETASEIDYLLSVSAALDIARKEADLSQIKEELTEGGYIRRKNVTKKKQVSKNEPLHFVSSDGFDIYVGKNNLQNDYLTFQFATGGDWWFHVKKAPGSHVIVKAGGAELPDRTFEEAAKLAVFYSSKSGADKAEVDYVEKKHVKKPAGSKPGFVVYYTNYSMMMDSDISGIREV